MFVKQRREETEEKDTILSEKEKSSVRTGVGKTRQMRKRGEEGEEKNREEKRRSAESREKVPRKRKSVLLHYDTDKKRSRIGGARS